MTAQDLRRDASSALPGPGPAPVSPSRLLASALLHLLDRDEPLPARWHGDLFTVAVARHRLIAGAMTTGEDLDRLAGILGVGVCRSGWGARSNPLAAALAVVDSSSCEARRSPGPRWCATA
ncbi:MAG: hypothetical protein U0838_09530 [Chloroflexota bacterium]